MSKTVEIVNKIDNRKSLITTAIAILIALFLLFFLKYHEPNPPKVDIPLPVQMNIADAGINNFEISNGGGGAPKTPSEATTSPKEDPPKEQPTQEESPVVTPTGNGSGDKPSPKPSETASEPASPFSGNGGTNGTGGEGTGFGGDVGPGTGEGKPGTGGSGTRIRVNDIKSQPKTPNSKNCKISLKLGVNSEGRVVTVQVIRQNTTTQNEVLIDEIKKLAKKEVKYKPKANSTMEFCFYTVNLRPS